MPTAWRIARAAAARTAFDGEGARVHGGRWNSPGTRVVYTAQGASLAALELLVHLEASRLLAAYVLIPVGFDETHVEVLAPERLPARWSAYPAPVALQEIGDRWVRSRRSVVLRVPSAVVPLESNFLINPGHPDFAAFSIGKPTRFAFDHRLRR
jgi:RES domain-containing protein